MIKWLEMQCRAVYVDTNLRDDHIHSVLEAEVKTRAVDFYVRHNQSYWSTNLPDDRSAWGWVSLDTASTEYDGAEGNTSPRSTIDDSVVSVNIHTDANFSWVEFLSEYRLIDYT